LVYYLVFRKKAKDIAIIDLDKVTIVINIFGGVNPQLFQEVAWRFY